MNNTLNKLLDEKLIAIIRNISNKDILKTTECLFNSGFHFIEVTFSSIDENVSKETLKNIELLKKYYGNEIHIGAGTVLNISDVKSAFDVGVEYIISPNVNVEVIEYTKKLRLISLPGAYTPSEAQLAYEKGADIIKIFPANKLGKEYFKEIKAPLSYLKLAAVGGISLNNVNEFLLSGADVVGIGNNLVNTDLIKEKRWEQITQTAKKYRDIVNNKKLD